VCKRMFLKTLVSERLVTYTSDKAQKAAVNTGFSANDQRRKHRPHNKTPDNQLDDVRRHILSLPSMDPHYTRADTNRQFLGSELNIVHMHELYKEQVAQLSQRDRAAGWVSYGQKWKTGTGRQYLRTI